MPEKIVHIFFAYTRDSAPLRDIARREIELINNWFSMKKNIVLRLHAWEYECVSHMGNPEQKVLERMPIEDADLFVAVFRFNYGQPTGNIDPDTKVNYKSGMEEEFKTAYRQWKEKKKPDIIILKSDESIPREYMRPGQTVEEIEAFFKEFQNNGKHPGLYNTFQSETEFAEVFRRNIMFRVIALLQDAVLASIPKLGLYGQNNGLLDWYLNGQNEIRNACKNAQIAKTMTLRLRARTCYSFLGRMGYFYGKLYDALERGATAQLIMQNPWSVNAIYAARGDESFREAFVTYKNRELTIQKLLEAYKESHWYKERYLASISGYRTLQRRFGERISLKFTDMDLSNAIFLTEEELYFEPYLNTLPLGQRSIPFYEIRAGKGAALYEDSERDFNDMWDSGCTFEDFCKLEDKYRERLQTYLDCLIRNAETDSAKKQP